MLLILLLKSIVLFAFTYLLIKIFISQAEKFGLVDIPNGRSSHKKPIPRGAGIIFGMIFIIGSLTFSLFQDSMNSFGWITFLAFVIVYLTGLYDDVKDIQSNKKFIFLIIASVLAYFDGFVIDSLGMFFGYELSLGILALPFTIFAIVGFTNAINLTDGLDGLAASLSIVILLSIIFIGYQHNDTMLICLPALLIAPLIAFLVFNWHPAKVFMGDSGSLFLGFVISLLAIKTLDYVNPVAIFFLAGIPVLDTFNVMRRRKQRGKSMFDADKNHIHHIILKYKGDKLFAVKMMIMMQIAFSFIFIQVATNSDLINLVLFVLLFIIFFNFFDPRAKYRPEKKKKKKEKKKEATYIDLLKRIEPVHETI